jgi:hypothetical protein
VLVNVTIKFGRLENLIGHRVTGQRFTFVPAVVTLDGNSFSMRLGMDEALATLGVPARKEDIGLQHRMEAIWTIGRLIQLFRVDVQPEEERSEKSMMNYSFIAAESIGDEVFGYPFECTYHYGSTALLFSDSCTDTALKNAIAADFWSLILSDSSVADFASQTFHLGGGFMMRYGIRAGEMFLEETED